MGDGNNNLQTRQYQCPHCGVVLETDAPIEGMRVDCPECGKEFEAKARGLQVQAAPKTPAPPSPAPAPRADVPPNEKDTIRRYPCPHCGAVFESSTPVEEGMPVACPACGREFIPLPLTTVLSPVEPETGASPQQIAPAGSKKTGIILALAGVLVVACLSVGALLWPKEDVSQEGAAEVAKWHRKAAEKGYAPSQFCLGWLYDKGCGVEQDDTEAVKWYRKAAEQGLADAQNSLGMMYVEGRGVAQSDTEAVKWFQKAAEQGLSIAQGALGMMYADGRGVAQSDMEAVKWYRKAAEQGDADAQFSLGVMYEEGRGVVKSDSEAVKWYRKAAEQGNDEARIALDHYPETKGGTQHDAQGNNQHLGALDAENGWMDSNPGIRIKATLNGKEVAATVTKGLAQSGWKTPVTVKLEQGGEYSFAATYEAGGKKYAGQTTVTAKERGMTEVTLALREMKGGVNAPQPNGAGMAEELRLQAAVADAAKNVEQGYNALSAGKPNEAERLFKAALKGLVARPQTAELLSSARWGLAESRYLQACAALEANHVQEARKLINAALEADSAHEDAKALEDYVNRNHGY